MDREEEEIVWVYIVWNRARGEENIRAYTVVFKTYLYYNEEIIYIVSGCTPIIFILEK